LREPACCVTKRRRWSRWNKFEAKMSSGKATFEDVDQFNRLLGNARRNYEALGLERVQRTVDGASDLIEHFGRRRAKP
jgi:hypothetical protein